MKFFCENYLFIFIHVIKLLNNVSLHTTLFSIGETMNMQIIPCLHSSAPAQTCFTYFQSMN